MNAMVPFAQGQVSRVFASAPVQDDLSAGVNAGFGLIGYKGKVWSIKYRGDELQLLRDDGDGARNSIEVVILASSKNLSKIFYQAGYVEGSAAPPDCFSTNGLTPDAGATIKQSATCAACPRNAWGSRISQTTGKPGKECSDSKRLAVVPLQDIPNELYGGPMLLRVPAASLQDLAQFGQKMQQLGYPYYSIGIRIGFDTAEAYPKFQFSAIRPLSDDEAAKVMELKASPAVARILAESSEFAGAAPAQVTVQSAFEQPPQVAPPAQQAPVQQVQQPQVVQQQWAPQPAPQQPSTGQVFTPPVQTVAAAPSPPAQPAALVSQPQFQAPVSPQLPSGGAPTAMVSQGGFGATARSITAAQSPIQVQATVQQATPQVQPEIIPPGAFEANLDAMMAKLLPGGA